MRILEKSQDFSRISISYLLCLFNPSSALTLTQMGQKTRPEAEIPPPDFSAFGEDFFVYRVAVRTLSMVFAASFWAAIVTWA